MKPNTQTIRLIIYAVAVMTLAACARMGRPEGGERDYDPPRYVRSNPPIGQLNFTGNKIEIFFDENIKLDDATNKVVVSPVQIQMPAISANGRRLTVELRDTLIPNTTYTIDLSDAVQDLNEGNVLDGFATDFSTGDVRDSLSISGMVFQARNLEPAQGMLVGVHSNPADSAIATMPFDRIAKTNQLGQFTIRNLAPGTYRVYALNDLNRDYRWDRSEDVAFYDLEITPQVEPIEVSDTLRASTGADSIVVRQGVRYLPNDILLTWFNENYRSQYLKDYARPDSTRVTFEFGAPSDTLPVFTVVDGPAAGKRLDEVALLDHSAGRDSLTYWITDRSIISRDSLTLAARYLRTDTLNQLSWTSDTLKLINRSRPKTSTKKKNKEKKDTINDSIPEPTFISFSPAGRAQHELNLPLRFNASQPLKEINPAGIHLDMMVDTVWTPVPGVSLQRDSVNRLLEYALHYDWEPGARYRFTADSLALRGIYGDGNRPVTHDFTVKQLEEYCNIIFELSGIPDSTAVVVELLNSSDNPVATATADSAGKAVFNFVTPGTYYARAFIDRNANGLWDTGNMNLRQQPEDIYYYSKKLNLRKNWDISQAWNLQELPVDKQKPTEIVKNKPKRKADEERKENEDEEDDEYDDFYNPGFNNSGNGSRNSNSSFSGMGDFRQARTR